jgi:succinoglycan biosynthesis protein ExoM
MLEQVTDYPQTEHMGMSDTTLHTLWIDPIDSDVAMVTRITLGVCTYKRPQLLTKCLASLTQLIAPYETELSIVIVDNEGSPQTREIVGLYEGVSNHPIRYIAEPRRGIASARNAVVEAALTDNADWIVMLDDDQVVPPDWLRKMHGAQARGHADVVKSSVDYQYPDPLPEWVFPRTKPFRGGCGLPDVSTNGVMFRASLVRPRTEDGRNLGLRFDEQFNLSSAEDRDFFSRAYSLGTYIVATPDAVATEFIPLSKCSFSAQVQRVYCHEVINAVQDRRLSGRLHTMPLSSWRCLNFLLSGSLMIIAGTLIFPLRRRHGRRRFFRGATKLARAAGICVGLIGAARPQPYLTIHGN